MTEPAREFDPKYLPWEVEEGTHPSWTAEHDGVLVCIEFMDYAHKAEVLIKTADGSISFRIDDPKTARMLRKAIKS